MKFAPFKWLEKIHKTKKDATYKYKSKWPIYNFSINYKTGMWTQFEEKIDLLAQKDCIQDINENDIDLFLDKNSDIEFEMIFFQKILSEVFFLKIKDVMYCYTTSIPKKNRIDARFYFDIEKFLFSDLF